MARLLLRRLAALVPILILVTFGTFMLVSLVPGDPAQTLAGGVDARPEEVAAIREELHLDEPLITQYGRWLGNAVQLDFGTSLYTGDSVSERIERAFPVTLSVALAALVIALAVGVPFGVVAGVRPNGLADRAVRTLAGIGFSIPNFLLGIVLVIVLAVQRNWLPPSGFVKITDSPVEWLRYVTLPALTLGYSLASLVARQLRAGMIDTLEANYVRAAWARGAPVHTVITGYAMKNAAIPLITTVGLQFGYLLGGTIIVEQIFAIPGLGSQMIGAIGARDLPIIQGLVVTFLVTQMALSLLMDLGYAWVNPKVKVG